MFRGLPEVRVRLQDPTRRRLSPPPPHLSCRCLGSACAGIGRPGDEPACQEKDSVTTKAQAPPWKNPSPDAQRADTYTMNAGEGFLSCGSARRA